jgi:heavy metal sensor kinase
MVLTLAAFGIVVYVAGRGAAYQQLDSRVRSAADLVAAILAESYRVGLEVVRNDAEGRPQLAVELATALEALPDYLVIRHREGRILFLSPAARALTFEQVQQLQGLPSPVGGGGASGTVQLEPSGPALRYAVRPITGAGQELGVVLAAADTAPTVNALDRLFATIVLLLLVGILAAVLIGEWIARAALQPVDQIITEVREITDGRSLHRRLAEPLVKDEIGRLAGTLNGMLARLEHSFTALRRFTADASHELKTPLTVLRAGVERMITHPKASPEALPVLEETLAEINRMTELVEALLTLARADEGQAELHRETVDLRTIVEEARETGELLAETAGVEMAMVTPRDAVVLDVDPSRMRELILNLVENAVKYTPRGGTVKVELARANGRVHLSVADTGIGIAPGDLPHIFDRFWRADTARTRTGERSGTGLGLAICKWIAEAHGGTIEVTSRPGRGTVFTVSLPQAAQPSQSPPPVPPPPAAPSRG